MQVPAWQEWLGSPARVCPRLAAPAIIRGQRLEMRINGQEHVVRAPRRYLDRLYRWCSGEFSRAEIDCFAQDARLGAPFSAFLDALLSAGLLVDAATYLPHTAQSAESTAPGKPAPEVVWGPPQAQMPTRLPAAAQALPSSALHMLAPLYERRRSALAFAPTALEPEQLHGLLSAMYGAYGSRPGGTAGRSVPSAGGFYGLSLSLALLKPVGQCSIGLHAVHFTAAGQVGLERFADLPPDLLRAFLQPYRLIHATGVVLVCSDIRMSGLKYRNRSYPYALLEAGASLQNAALAAAEQGIGWRTLGGIDSRWLVPCFRVHEKLPLACGVFGSLPSDQQVSKVEGKFSFAWVDAAEPRRFHLASARWSPKSASTGGPPCWGRDRDPQRAYDKAVAEAVERAAYRCRRGAVTATAAQLPDEWLHPDRLARYTSAQYRRADFPFARFDPHRAYRWVQTTRMGDDKPVWVPADFVFARSSSPLDKSSRPLFHATSSGCASHRNLDEAVQAAVLELVERDAFLRHWLAQRSGMKLPLDQVPSCIRGHADDLRALGCEVTLQVLSPLGLPVWMVAARSEAAAFTCVSAATGLNPEAALESAFNETYTAATTRLAGRSQRRLKARDVRSAADHADLHAMNRHFRRTDAILAPAAVADPQQVLADWPRSFDQWLEALKGAGAGPVHWVDLSLGAAPRLWSGEEIRTVRALVPGLVPLAFGHGLMPHASAAEVSARGRFPHPFP